MVLEASMIHLLKSNGCYDLIVDIGCSKVVTSHFTDFVSGSLTKLYEPMDMDGITGLLVADQKGRVQYEVINDSGGLSILDC